jgi:GT2 family glycosyltransferase
VMPLVDILIPTYQRPAALAVTCACLIGQTFQDFRVVISDQGKAADPWDGQELSTVFRVLRAQGHELQLHEHLPRRGLAEHRQFLLDQAQAPFVLFLDDDLVLESKVLERMVAAIQEEHCGFVGCAPIGLSYIDDVRPHQQTIEFWTGPVMPERIEPSSPEWKRHQVHSAANLYHVQQRIGLRSTDTRKYRVAWVGACVLFDTAKLRRVGGFEFWRQLPAEHCGEDVLVQLRLLRRCGGCGLLPSGVYHQELPTTVVDRRVNAPEVLPLDSPAIEPAVAVELRSCSKPGCAVGSSVS